MGGLVKSVRRRLDRVKATCPVTGQPIPSIRTIKRRLEKGLQVKAYGFPESWRGRVAWAIARVYYESSKTRGIPETVRRGEIIFEGASPVILQSSQTETMRTGIKIPVWSDRFDRKGFTALVQRLMDECENKSRVRPALTGDCEGEFSYRSFSDRFLGLERASKVLEGRAGDRQPLDVSDRRRVIIDIEPDQ